MQVAMQIAYWGIPLLFLAGGISYAFRPRRTKGERPRLNVWMRSGIALSLLWLPTGFVWQGENENAHNLSLFDEQYSFCRDQQDREIATNPNPDTNLCMTRGRAMFDIAAINDRTESADAATTPLILGWILAFLSLWITRWILGGRLRPDTAAAE